MVPPPTVRLRGVAAVAPLTVSGSPAASLQPASTPGFFTIRYVEVLALKVWPVQVMPVAASTAAAPRVTVAVIPEEQVVPVTVPLAQYVKESEVAVPVGV